MAPRYRRSVPFTLARRALAVPDRVVQLVAGDPIEVDGRVLNRTVQLMLAVEERTGLGALNGDGVAERRARMQQATALGMPIATDLHVSDRYIPGGVGALQVRVYRPYDLEPTPPAIVFFHGGGWVVGDLDSHDGSCRVLAIESGCVVVSVDYRLAPEHVFPAAVEDCVTAYRWVVANAGELSVDPHAVAVMGDSAGGNLAAVVAQVARDLDVAPPVAQGLVYPGLDFRMETRSIELFAEGFFLSRADMDWFCAQYLPDPADITNPLASPALAEDLRGVAPAWVWTAGFDPLRDEGRAYAEALDKAGVVVHQRCYDDQVHGFFGMGVLPGGLDIITEMSRQMGALVRAAR
jgi:acetyl esterase